ncbi:MAG: M48 family metallopeptidase [Ignavibacteriales bacterium]|nr:M48 family metallopeptidase [Ignavibacteriales bacterium]
MKLGDHHIEIKRSTRKKTLSIFIERNGTVSVIAPQKLSEDKIHEALVSKEYLIYKRLAEWKELNKGKVNREFVNGQSFLYLGKNYRLNLIGEQDKPLLLKNGYFNLRKDRLHDAEKVFEKFYKEKGLPKIKERIRLLENKFNKRPNEIKIMELRNRWASWTPKGKLNFHWKCIMAPVSVLDYIIVHEMVHLTYPNHSKNFWNEVDKIMPNFREYESWLKQHGVKMDL